MCFTMTDMTPGRCLYSCGNTNWMKRVYYSRCFVMCVTAVDMIYSLRQLCGCGPGHGRFLAMGPDAVALAALLIFIPVPQLRSYRDDQPAVCNLISVDSVSNMLWYTARNVCGFCPYRLQEH